jgi:D-glycero-alpha-D-manno-heptose-7-phosphate kinase
MKVECGVEIHHDGDLPARSGLGSSSSFVVGLLNALYALEGRMVSKHQLAEQAIHIEQNVIAEHVGSQDQIWAAYGGMNRIDFLEDGSFQVVPALVKPGRRAALQSHLMLFFTGISRFASLVAEKKIAALEAHTRHIRTMVAMVDESLSILGNDNTPITQIGTLLGEAWALKRDLTDAVSTPEIDAIYQAAMDAGALGGKLLGAGGGGFMLFFVAPHKQQAVREKLAPLIEVQFDIDHGGSKIVVYEPEGLANC